MIPTSLHEAIEALQSDVRLQEVLGHELVDSFLVVKKFELERYNQWVGDWEIREYMHHL